MQQCAEVPLVRSQSQAMSNFCTYSSHTGILQATGDALFAEVTRDILEYVSRDLTDPVSLCYLKPILVVKILIIHIN